MESLSISIESTSLFLKCMIVESDDGLLFSCGNSSFGKNMLLSSGKGVGKLTLPKITSMIALLELAFVEN